MSAAAPATPRGRALRLAGLGAAVAALSLLGLPLCPFAAVTGIPCPGCGLTRATLALAQGHLGEALHLHPLSPVVGPLVGGFLGYAGLVYIRTGRWPGSHGAAAGRLATVVIAIWTLLCAVWLARFHGAFGGPVPV